MYEVRSISHSGGESLADGRRGDVQILDMSKLMDRFIDMLDAWVEKGVAPPPTRSDWAELGDVNRDGTIEQPGARLSRGGVPARRLLTLSQQHGGNDGVCRRSPARASSRSIGNKVFVDMNRNGVWDFRETPTQAWRRLGLLKAGEELTREAYVSCAAGGREPAAERRLLHGENDRLVYRAGEERSPRARAVEPRHALRSSALLA